MKNSISIIIPAYNEEKRIGKTLSDYLSFFKDRSGFELIVVLNGCKDNTLGVVEGFSKNKMLRHKNFARKIGKGGAVIEGFKLAAMEYLGYVDADGSTKPEDFLKLFQRMNGYDGIIASRHVEGAVVGNRQPFGRIVAGRGFNLLVRALFGLPFKDTQCGAKIFRKSMIAKILPEVGTTGWAFDIDLLFKAGQHGFNIGEVPTIWSNFGESKLDMKRSIPGMLLSVLRLRLLNSPFRVLF